MAKGASAHDHSSNSGTPEPPGTRDLRARAAMDRNGNFDYRNLFYPGPGPFPVQIYPVNGDPRFPFHFPSGGAPNFNMARGDSSSPLAREENTPDDAALDQPESASPATGGGMVAKRDAAAQVQAATTSPPVKLDHVAQGLSHLLGEAITFCEECITAHKEVVAAARFASPPTRDSLWRELLESRFEDSGVHKDLLHTLVPRVRRYTQQAQQAARDDPAARSAGGGDRDGHYRMSFTVDRLVALCVPFVQENRRALGSSVACESMVELMKEMVRLCGRLGAGGEAAPQDGQEGGDRQY